MHEEQRGKAGSKLAGSRQYNYCLPHILYIDLQEETVVGKAFILFIFVSYCSILHKIFYKINALIICSPNGTFGALCSL